MSLSVGIIGLPNTGKSTLFEAITRKQVDRANYPFCTIEPNLGTIAVPDERLDALAKIFPKDKKIPAIVEFVDIAGLIAGASQGEGLGNKFLAHIREVSAILYVLRGFNKESIINTLERIDPWFEKEILDTELALKDIETIEKRIIALEKEIKASQSEALREKEILDHFIELLKNGKFLVDNIEDDFSWELIKKYQLLTGKPRLYLINANKDEVDHGILGKFEGHPLIILDALIELEACDLTAEERQSLELDQSGLDELIRSSYRLLDLITFFTIGRNEIRAWTLRRGQTAPQAGGVIHTDFENNFIKAEIIKWNDLIEAGNFAVARQKGLIRTEGREYQIQDGDVVEIKSGI